MSSANLSPSAGNGLSIRITSIKAAVRLSEGAKRKIGLLMLVVNIVITMGALAFCDRQEECLARDGISVEQLLREGVRHE